MFTNLIEEQQTKQQGTTATDNKNKESTAAQKKDEQPNVPEAADDDDERQRKDSEMSYKRRDTPKTPINSNEEPAPRYLTYLNQLKKDKINRQQNESTVINPCPKFVMRVFRDQCKINKVGWFLGVKFLPFFIVWSILHQI